MNGGELNFRLGMDTAEATKNIARATVATNALTSRTVSFTSANRATEASVKAVSSAMSVIGYQVAPQMTAQIHSATLVVKQLNVAAQATGVGIAGIGVAALGVVGILATLNAAVETARAKLNETAVEQSTSESLKSLDERLRKQIVELAQRGKLSKDEAINLQVGLELSRNNVETLYASVQAVQRRLRELIPPQDLKSLGQLNRLEAELKAKTLTGKDRSLAELDLEIPDLINKAEDLAKKSGVDFAETKKIINAFVVQRRAEIDQQFAPNTQTATGGKQPRSQVTDAEKIGFIMGGLGRGFGGGDDRDVANNTKNTVKLLTSIDRKISSDKGNNFANIQ
jgi:hypothetical protein